MAYDLKYGDVRVERGDIREDELVVVFRARDALLPGLLKVYRLLCEVAGSPEHHLEGIHDAAMAVRNWQAVHGSRTPTSDALVDGKA